MTFYNYAVCENCGRIVRTEETTMSGDGEVDGKSYRKIKSKYCGCTTRKVTVDIAKGQ